MRTFSVICVAIASLCTINLAAADTLAVMQANAVTIRDSEGNLLSTWRFSADGTYEMRMPDGTSSTGVYTSSETQFCYTPRGQAEPSCSPALPSSKHLGDSWTVPGAGSTELTVSIEPIAN